MTELCWELRWVLVALICAWGSSEALLRAQAGFDVGTGAVKLLETLEGERALALKPGGWLRIRGLAGAEGKTIEHEKEALKILRKRGFKICALVEWPESIWKNGVRPGGGRRIAVDLREVWERARLLGREFASCVDAWEIGNEPDISFLEENPETYAAFLKTCRLGLRAEAKEAAGKKALPKILIAPMGMPPGPYFDRLWENGAGGSTDGFNFHFYGYAEDFSDVYGQFRDAVEGSAEKRNQAGSGRELPVFMTEYGYGLMDGDAGKTAEGRERQRRWFHKVGEQLKVLKLEAPMSFVLMPYLEQGKSEFGLLMNASGSGEATVLDLSPALRGLIGEGGGSPRVKPQSWPVTEPVDDAPVVLDFVARDGLEQRKSFLGYFVRGVASEGTVAGWGEIILYNFANEKAVGMLTLGGGLTADGAKRHVMQLEPGERRVVQVRAEIPAKAFRASWSGALFSYENKKAREVSTTRLVTTLWPDPAIMDVEILSDFSHEEKSITEGATRLLSRWRASEEPALQRQGRWLVARGVSVIEKDGGRWTFKVDALPEEPARPAMAELPLPEDFVFGLGMLLEFSHRLTEGSAETEAWFDVYFRTENGNLYQVWPRSQAGRDWRGYAEGAENFTMAFFGRAKLPWWFLENKPAALVFFFRPEKLPAIFEIEDAAITRRVAK